MPSHQQQKRKVEQVDYYALLNVPKSATREEIKSAYTRLARVLHPDKQARLLAISTKDDSRYADLERKEAQELFILVDKAYKVLSSDTERVIYDSFGMEGLMALYGLASDNKKKRKTEELQLVCDYTSQVGFYDERGFALRDKILGRVHLERELEEIGRFNMRGAVQVNVDGQGLLGNVFEPPSEYDIYNDGDESPFRFELPSISGIVVQQFVEANLSRTDSITLGAHTQTRGSVGGHSVSIGHEHRFSEAMSSELTLTTSLQDPFGLSLKGNRVLSQYAKGSLEFVTRQYGKTGLNLQAARKLSETLTGVLQLGFGIESGVLLQVNHASRFGKPILMSKREQEDYYYDMYYSGGDNDNRSDRSDEASSHDSETGPSATSYFSNGTAMLFLSHGGNFGLHTSWTRSVSAKSHAKIGLKLSVGNVAVEITSARVLSAHSKGSVTLSVGLVGGVILTVRYDRGGLRYVLPVSLTSTLSFGAAIVGGIVPSLVNFAFLALVRPYWEKRLARQKFETVEGLLKDRERALIQMRIMSKSTAQRKQTFNLVVLRARYGVYLHREYDWRDVESPKLDDFIAKEKSRPRLPSDWDMDDDEEENDREEEDASTDSSSITTGDEGDTSLYKTHPPNIDVTEQLNFLCTDTSLELHGGTTKSNLMGFYNPAVLFNKEPSLYIRYKLGSYVFEITVDDLEPLSLPSPRAMLIGNTMLQPNAQF